MLAEAGNSTNAARFWRAAVLCRFPILRMGLLNGLVQLSRPLASSLIVSLALVVFSSACSRKESENSPAAPEKKEASRVSHGTNGEIAIKLDAETQKLIGLQTAALSPVEVSPEIKTYGRVLDTASLASQVADLASANAASTASQAELARLKSLAAQNNASTRALEAAEAAAARDQVQTEAARLKLLGTWGSVIAGRQDLAAFVRSLSSLESVLVQLNFSPSDSPNQIPTHARILTLADGAKPIEAQFVGPAPAIDPLVQGRGLLFLISPNTLRLAPGTAVTGFIDSSREIQNGVTVPRDAIVRFNGVAWVYVQAGDDTFHRTEARLERPMPEGWFVREKLNSGVKIVIKGAQQLLSEELKGDTE